MLSKTFRLGFRGESPRMADWEAVFVCGDAEALGAWDPARAVALTRSLHNRHEWTANVRLQAGPDGTNVQYRYFIAQFLDPFRREAGVEIRHEMVIVSFENHIQPRMLTIYPSTTPPKDVPVDVYGKFDEGAKENIDEGWLLRQSEVRLRLQSTTFWKNRYKDRTLRVRVTPVDLRYREIGASMDEDDEMSRDGNEAPTLPSHTQCLLSVMGEDGFQGFSEQDPFGHNFDETQFHVFRTQTVAPEFLAFRFDFYMGKAGETASESEVMELMGVGHFMPSNDPKETRATRIVSITSLKHQPVGQFTVDYLMIHPLAEGKTRGDLSVSYARYWRKRVNPLDIGHRGLGNSYTKFTGARENTVLSLTEAANHGADFVEFDVQLSKDRIPVVFHDFHVCVNVKRRQGSTLDLLNLDNAGEKVTELYQLGVKDLKLNQLQMLKIDHSSLAEGGESGALDVGGGASLSTGLHVVSEEMMDEDMSTAPFPTLAQVLAGVPCTVGFNVEIKSPLMGLDGAWETEAFWERNLYLDAILEVVLNDAADRRIVFSSFDPDVCSMLKMKQNRYPVLFLTQGKTQRYAPFLDKRANTSLMAVAFASSSNILGVNFHSEELLRDSTPLYAAQNQGLVSFVWGDDLDNKDTIRYFRQLAVDGLIYDRIHTSGEGKQNVFLVEKQQRDELLRKGLSGSERELRGWASDSSQGSPSPPPLPSGGSSTTKFKLSPPVPVPPPPTAVPTFSL